MSTELKPCNKTKELIIDRLYKTSSRCSFCGKSGCGHGGNRELVSSISVDDVLKAINYDEYFFKENTRAPDYKPEGKV